MANTSTKSRGATRSTPSTKTGAADNPTSGSKSEQKGISIKDTASAAREKIDTAIETTRDAGQEALKQVQETGRVIYDDGSDMVRSAHSEFDQAVRRNPGVAMLGALGIGVLIGFAFKARS